MRRNCRTSRFPVPQFIRSDAGLGSQIGVKLDAALTQLYNWCAPNSVPIMAHTNNTFGQNQDYRDRANPEFWRNVIKTSPNIRINLAHFGHFNKATLSNQGVQGVENCWEWITGDIFNSFPDSYVFADVSSLSEIMKFDSSPKAAGLHEGIQAKIPEQRPASHVWNRLVIRGAGGRLPPISEPPSPIPTSWSRFSRRPTTAYEQIKNIMFRNAARFLGISKIERDK